MSSLKLNVMANFAGKGWAALMGLAFVPLYIKFLGIEAYGLIGFYVVLQAVFVFLDFGLSLTINRELARSAAVSEDPQKIVNLVRTLECIYWGMAVLIGVILVSIAPLVATSWIKANELPSETVSHAIMLLGIVIAFQWPFALYSGGLLGLQRQVLLNALQSSMATVKGVGAVFILWLVSPTIEAFFLWQAGVGLCSTLLMGNVLWRSLPKSAERPRSNMESLRTVWRFAADVTAISVLGAILYHMDKILLSALLPLKIFGYYTLATVVASPLYHMSSPINAAVFPKFSQLVAENDESTLRALYHKSSQFMSVAILPVSAWLCIFSKPIILLWTQNPDVTENTHFLASLLVLGTVLSVLLILPYSLQMAYGWTRLAVYSNLAAIIILVPSLIIMTRQYGVVGAAVTWILLNVGHFLITVPIMHTRILKGELAIWYVVDNLLPFVVALTVTLAMHWVLPIPNETGMFATAGILGISLLATAFATAISVPASRAILFQLIDNHWSTNKGF